MLVPNLGELDDCAAKKRIFQESVSGGCKMSGRPRASR